MKVLIGYDGSPAAADIFEDLKTAGLPKRLDAKVVTVADVSHSVWVKAMSQDKDGKPRIDPPLAEAIAQADATAKDAADLLRKMFPLWNVTSGEGQWESPVWSLIQMADEWEADLLVVGARGHGALGRFLGSVSQMILVHARCSVRIARVGSDNAARPGSRVLVGFDGSPGAEKAMAAVAARSWPAGTKVRVVSASPLVLVPQTSLVNPGNVRPGTIGYEEGIRFAEKKMEQTLTPLHRLGVDAESFVRVGNAKNILVEEAEPWKADCIFLGASGMRTVRRFFLGSVSAAVAARAHCSVEIIR